MVPSWNVNELEAGLRALVRTLAPHGPLLAGAARMVQAVQRHLGTHHDVTSLAPIDDAMLAAQLRDPWLRQQLVRALVVGLLVDGAPPRAGLARVEEIARLLGVIEPALRDVALFLAGKRLRLRLHVLRRFWAFEHVRARIAERGFLRAVAPAVLATFFGLYRDRALAARYAGLRRLPAGTLGHGYLAYLEANGFSLPGERGAVSDIIVQHDLAHVLGGYDTTSTEETLVATFSAGHRVKDPFAFVVFVLFQFHLGVRMTPGARAEVGYFDPERVLAAIARGAAMNIDLTARWDYWADMAEPLDALRRRYGISPRDASKVPAKLAA